MFFDDTLLEKMFAVHYLVDYLRLLRMSVRKSLFPLSPKRTVESRFSTDGCLSSVPRTEVPSSVLSLRRAWSEDCCAVDKQK